MPLWGSAYARKKLIVAVAGAVVLTGLVSSATTPADAAVFTPTNHDAVTFTNDVPGSSDVLVVGSGGAISNVSVTIYGLRNSRASDVDIELVSPSGVAVPLVSDACFGAGSSFSDADLTFTDFAANFVPALGPCSAGTYRPINYGANSTDVWPVTPNATSLAGFNGSNPDGTWTLYVSDDDGTNTDDGLLARGFDLTVTTNPFQALLPGQGTAGVSSPYPVTLPVSNRVGVVTDVNLELRGVSHQSIADLDIVVVAPTGAAAWLVSDACGQGVSENLVDWTFDDEATSRLPGPGAGSTATCASGSYKPSTYVDADSDALPAPAPAGPYSTSLSVFDGINPNGPWRIYAVDDATGGGGFLTGAAVDVTTLDQPTTAPPIVVVPDTASPDTKFTRRPHRTIKRRARFEFTSNEPGVHFQCKLDHGTWVPCSSPTKVKHLRFLRHRFKVRAIDAAGNVDPSPARARWRVLHSLDDK